MKRIILKSYKYKNNLFFSVIPFQYYGLKFYSKAEGKAGYWAVIFYDKQGRKMVSDHYSSFETSENLKENIFYFKGKENSAKGKLLFTSPKVNFQIKDISIWKAEKEEVLKWADKIYSILPEFKLSFPGKRCEKIPEVIKKLKMGKRVRMVLLGDSIMNDIGNSPFDVLIERNYPASKVEVITSVLGSTGCWYYKKGNRVKKFVFDFNPDLLVIGGISNRNDVESIREVISKTKKYSENIEVMILSKAFGRKRNYDKKFSFKIPCGNNSYRRRLAKMAEEEGVEFFDIEGFFGEYVKNCGLPYEFFMRDKVHANVYGRQIIARIISEYFTV